MTNSFEAELASVLPADVPNREALIQGAGRHLELIVEANQYLNLTRITGPRDAAIKHVLDSVIPWRLFEKAPHVLDAGTGPGFPGVPLALVLPHVRFILAESIQKKARFVESVLTDLKLLNAQIAPRRAEEFDAEIITARALAPVSKALALFKPALKRGSKLLLYKGPDVESEIEEAAADLRKQHLRARVVMRYELPDGMGIRSMVEIGSE